MTDKITTQDVQVQNGGQLATPPRRVVTPPTDVIEKNDRIVATLDMPGVDPASLEVTFSEGNLRVQGKTRLAEAETDATSGVTYAEFELGDYERVFRVQRHIDAANITADLADGVLTVELPLERPARTRVAVRTA